MRYLLFILLFCSTVFGSLVIDADNESVTITDNAALTLPDGDWTVSFWIKSTDADITQTLSSIISLGGYGSVSSFNIFILATGDVLYCNSRDASSIGLTLGPTGDIADQTWHHVVIRRTGVTAISIYVDGSSVNSGDPDDSMGAINGTGSLYIGEFSGGYANNNFLGKIAEVAKWDSALTDTDIDQLSGTGGYSATPATCLASGTQPAYYVPLYANDTEIISDLTTTTNNATYDEGDHPISVFFFVAEDGNDSNAGSIDEPWLTIQHGIKQCDDGDTLYVRGGTYRETVTFDDDDISVIGYPGETAIIDGTTVLSGTWGQSGTDLTDFTDWGETDPQGYLTVGATSIVAANLPKGDADGETYVAVASALADSTAILFTIRVEDSSDNASIYCPLVVSDETIDEAWADQAYHNQNSWCLTMLFASADTVTINLLKYGATLDTSSTLADETDYYVTVEIIDTAVTAYIYSDSARTTLVDSITGTVNDVVYDNYGMSMYQLDDSAAAIDSTISNFYIGRVWNYTVEANANQMWIDGTAGTLSHFPASGYESIDDANETTTTIVDATLNQPDDYWNGATVYKRYTYYNIATSTITDSDESSTNITFGEIGTDQVGDGWGFMIVNEPQQCDTDGEWACIGTTLSLFLDYGTDPNDYTITAATKTYGIDTNEHDDLTFQNLTIRKTTGYGIYIDASDTITVDGCTISETTGGILAENTCDAITITDNTISDIWQASGIYLHEFTATTGSCVVTGNALQDINSNTEYPTTTGQGIRCDVPIVTIANNTLDDLGRNGIYMHGAYVDTAEVYNNTITDYMLGSADGGAIYCGQAVTETNIYNNTIRRGTSNLDGAPASASYTSSDVGIYVDYGGASAPEKWPTNYNIYYNLIETGGQGIQIHNGVNNEVYNNTIYAVTYGIRLQEDYALATDSMTGNVIKNNIIYQTADDTYAIYEMVLAASTPYSQTYDNNLYYNSVDIAECIYWISTSGTIYNFANWKSTTSYDASSVGNDNPDFVTAGSDFRLLNGSPAQNTGADVSLTTDIDSLAIFGSAPEMGCYEYCPTEIVRYVDVDLGAGNGTASGSSAWAAMSTAEAAIDDLGVNSDGDLTARDETYPFGYYVTLNVADGTDTTAVTWAGNTTGVDNFISVEGDGTYTLGVSNSTVCGIGIDHINFDDVSFVSTSRNANDETCVYIINVGSGSIYNFTNCIFRGADNDTYYSYGVYLRDADAMVNLNNCLVYNMGQQANSKGIRVRTGTLYAYNCTIDNCALGIYVDDEPGILYANNCIVSNSATAYSLEAGGTIQCWNCTGDDATVKTYDQDSSCTASVTPSYTGLYRLGQTNTTWVGTGANLSNEAHWVLTAIDIDEEDRGSSWDIGWDQYNSDLIRRMNLWNYYQRLLQDE